MKNFSRLPAFIGISLALFTAPSPGQLDQNFINNSRTQIEQIRMRDGSLTISNPEGSAEGLSVTVTQLRHHFGFGAAIGYDFLVSTPGYAESFLKFFEWAVFENDMKWPATDPTPDGPDYSKPDSLIEFCRLNDIKVRGHNLFWNQQEDWFPTWTLNLDQTEFVAAVDDRINNAMAHFAGRVEHWDIVNEIIHGSVLQDHSGDPNIINDIFIKSRNMDPNVKLTVNDFNILVWNSTQDYINNVNGMLNAGVPIDIIGCEGHFGDELNQDYAGKLNQVATIGLPIWVTELDFSTSGNVADEFERLMRTFYGHESVEGVVMWAWWEGNKWREELNSTVVNEDFTNTALGNRFQQLMEEWTTQETGATDADGVFSFRGYHGKYLVTISDGTDTYADTLYLEPGSGNQEWAVLMDPATVPNQNSQNLMSHTTVLVNGTPILFSYEGNAALSFTIATTSGKILQRMAFDPAQSRVDIPDLPTGYYVYRIESGTREIKSGLGFNLNMSR